MKLSTAKRRINKTLDELTQSVIDDWYDHFKNGYIKGYTDARKGVAPMFADAIADTPQTEETCGRCVYVRGSQWCQGCNGTPKRWDGEKIVDTPQTESTGSPIGDYRDGVGAWQTDCGWK